MDDQETLMPHRTSLLSVIISGALAFLSVGAGAQGVAPTQPSTSESRLPTKLQYKSAIGSYQAYADQEVLSWREANDRVGRIGGWRAYAKEISTGQPPSEAPTSPDSHATHHGGEK
jgi:hypothetical protein